jgi:hypothetical protein
MAMRFLCADRAAGEDHVECARMPDQAREPYRAAVDQRHAPAPAEDAESRGLLHHAQIAPQREFQPAGHRIARDRGDHRLGQQHARGAERCIAVFAQ